MTDIAPIKINFLNGLSLEVNGESQTLPSSRKTRALLAYLTLNPRHQRRTSLSALFWEHNSDPRAALRWALSKLRPLLGDALIVNNLEIALDRNRLSIDLVRLGTMLESDACPEQLRALESSLEPPYLGDLDCETCPVYQLWLESERSLLRDSHRKLLKRIVCDTRLDSRSLETYAQRWLTAAPGSIEAASTLLAQRLKRDGLRATQNLFEQIRGNWLQLGVDDSELLLCWRKLSDSTVSTRATASANHAILLPVRPISKADSGQKLALPDKPSLAILGFTDLDSAGPTALTRGLTIDLTSRLSTLSGLFVSAAASSSRFLHSDLPLPDIGERLGVAYLLKGTCQQSGQRWRVTVHLLEARRAEVLWAETFDFDKQDVFELQDEITDTIVSRVEPEIERAEYERLRHRNPVTYSAWENYHVALWHAFRFTPGDTEVAHTYLRRALEQDASFSRAHAAISLVHFNRAFLNCSASEQAKTDAQMQISEAQRSAQHCLSLDSRDAMGHWSLGRALFLAQQHDPAMASLQRALQVNPNYAQGHYALGFIRAHGGIADAAVPELDRAARLSPYDPLLFAMKSSRAISLAIQGRYAEAADWSVAATGEANAHYHISAIAAACLELAGNSRKARQYVDKAVDGHPGYCRRVFFRSFPYKDEKDRVLMEDALSRAGLSP